MCLDIGNVILLDILVIGINLCNDCVVLHTSLALTLVNDDIDYAGSCNELVFDFFGINVLTVGENDEILFTSGNIENIVFVKLTVVTGFEVTVLSDRILGCGFILKVTQHYVGTCYPNFALAILVGLVDLNGVNIQNVTYTAAYGVSTAVNRNNGSALGNAVAVEGGNTDGFEKAENFGIDGSTAGNDHFYLAAKCRTNFCKQLCTNVNANLQECIADFDHASNKLFLLLLFQVCHNTAVECFEIQRNDNQVLGFLLLEFLCYIAQTTGDIDFTTDHHMTDQHYGRTKGMVRRQNTNRLFTEIHIRNNGGKVGENCILRKHYAFALAGCAGGEYQQRHGMGINRCIHICIGICCKFCFATLHQGCKRYVTLFAAKIYSRRYEGDLTFNNSSLLFEICIAEEEFCIGTLNGCCKILSLPVAVKRNEYTTDGKHRIIGKRPLVGKLADNRAMTACTAHCQKFTCQRANVIAELDKALFLNFRTRGRTERVNGVVAVIFSTPFEKYSHIVKISRLVNHILIHNEKFLSIINL